MTFNGGKHLDAQNVTVTYHIYTCTRIFVLLTKTHAVMYQ